MKAKNVYIEITNRCNFNCATCYNRSGLNKETREISPEQLEFIISLLSEYGADRFLISGGEPSLHSRFDEILDFPAKYPEMQFGFVTNGSSRNPKFVEILNNQKNTELQISLDGADEEKNSLTRGKGHFDMTVDFAKLINTPSKKPLLKMVLSQNNIDDVEKFYRLALSLGFMPEFAFIYSSGNGSDEWERKKLSPQQKLKALKTINRLNKETGNDAFLPLCTKSCPFVGSDDTTSICIKTDGSIQPCQAMYMQEYTLGNIFDFDKSEYEKNVTRITGIARERSKKDYGCSKCIIKDICHHGCMAEAANLCKDPLGDDDGCMYRKLAFVFFEMEGQIENAKKSV